LNLIRYKKNQDKVNIGNLTKCVEILCKEGYANKVTPFLDKLTLLKDIYPKEMKSLIEELLKMKTYGSLSQIMDKLQG